MPPANLARGAEGEGVGRVGGVGVLVAPVIPFLTDHQIEAVLEAAWEHGAGQGGYVLMRLPGEVSPLFRQWLEAHLPDRAARVMNRVRDIHGGKDYDSSFGKRMHGEGIWADLIRQRFEKTVARLGIGVRSGRFLQGLDTSLFRRPATPVAPQPPKLELKKKPGQKPKPGGQFELF